MRKSQFITRRISDKLYLNRHAALDTRFFEALWELPEGMLYNSYAFITNEGVVVFDTTKKGYCSEYLEELSSIIDLRDVKYIVGHHGEPDHSGCIKELSDASNAVVIGLGLLGKQLRQLYKLERFKPVKDGESISLGEYTFNFIHVPWLHWPETIVTYVIEPRYLFTCDVFGSYGTYVDKLYYDELNIQERNEYIWYTIKYFANVIGYYREWAPKNINKLLSLGINPQLIAPAHGLIYRGDYIKEMIELYNKLGKGEILEDKVLIINTSMYGFGKEAVDDLVRELKDKGIEPIIYEFNDEIRMNISDVIGASYKYKVIVITASTYEAGAFPLAKYMVEILAKKTPRNRNIVILGAYTWSPRAGYEISKILSESGFTNVKVIEYPSGEHDKAVKEAVEYISNSR